jgi:FkbM family methyltransferase
MIPIWIKKIKPRFLREYIKSQYIESRLNRWDREGILLNLRPISKPMQERIIMGEYESNEINLCKKYISENDRVLEIGSAIGFVSLFCLKQIGVTQICCVEPNPLTSAILKENYLLNGFQPTLIEGCFSGNDGKVFLSISEYFWVDRIQKDEDQTDGVKIEVSAYSLETILSKVPFQPNVIVMDVEGAELNLRPTDIPEYIDYLIVETHPKRCGWNETYKHVAEFLSNGFFLCERVNHVFVLKNERR